MFKILSLLKLVPAVQLLLGIEVALNHTVVFFMRAKVWKAVIKLEGHK